MLGAPEAPDDPLAIYVDEGFQALVLALPDDPYGSTVVRALPSTVLRRSAPVRRLTWSGPTQFRCLDLYAEPSTEHLADALFALWEGVVFRDESCARGRLP